MQRVLEQYPKWRSEIEQLYLESADFQELCHDYEEVRSLLETWKAAGDVSQSTSDGYQQLLNDLESEIREELEARFDEADMPQQNTTVQSTKLKDWDDGLSA